MTIRQPSNFGVVCRTQEVCIKFIRLATAVSGYDIHLLVELLELPLVIEISTGYILKMSIRPSFRPA